jgi:hypothetical protein
MRRTMDVPLLVLAFSMLSAAQDRTDQGDVFKKDVDLVSVYFTVRDSKKGLASQLEQAETSGPLAVCTARTRHASTNFFARGVFRVLGGEHQSVTVA